MAGIPKEHGTLYFDALCRTQKKETIYSLIKATYYAKNRGLSVDETKNEIARRLQNAYGLYKDNIRGYDNGYGSYQGGMDQFQSQYTIGHEMSIWKNSELDLNDLALKVAKDEITVVEYFDTILLNYFQPIQSKAVHPLYCILKYMKENNIKVFEKQMLGSALNAPTEEGATNGLFNILGDTSYFSLVSNKLELNKDVNLDLLIEKCNIKYIGEEGLNLAKIELASSESYVDYITSKKEITMEIEFDDDLKELTELEKFEKFYSENLLTLKSNIELYDEIRARNEFNSEYPLERLKTLTLEEYALGTENFRDSLSHKLEFGAYFKSGLPVVGYSSGKHGIYLNKNGVYCNYRDKEIENPEEFWIEFRTQLYNFLVEVENCDTFPNVAEKYPLVKNVPGLATKLCYLYYPKRFINIGKRDVLVAFVDKFEIENEDSYSPKLSFILSKYLRENISILNDDDPQWVGSALWRYKDYVPEEEPKDISSLDEVKPYSSDKFKKEVFIPDSQYDDIVSLLKRKKNIILTGAPGVGKTFMAKRLVYSLQENTDKSRMLCIQFHQSYSYEEFIEGYRPLEDGGFKLEKGIFYNFCKECAEDPEGKPYYLIIDEINRGNLSKIFGELLMLIESDKRGDKLQLAYSKKEFSVPKNLYIIGLMNTADRSLALMDYALRRRFSFINIEPAYGTPKFKDAFEKMFDNTYDEAMKLVEDINDEIKGDLSLGEGFMIGHSYFCLDTKDDSKGNNEDIKNILKYEIKPLIEEYWYDEKETKDKWVNKIKEYIER